MFRPLRAIFRWIIYTSYYYSGYVVRIYLVLCFWRCFSVVSLYVVDMLILQEEKDGRLIQSELAERWR
jgi:hypothetical protein